MEYYPKLMKKSLTMMTTNVRDEDLLMTKRIDPVYLRDSEGLVQNWFFDLECLEGWRGLMELERGSNLMDMMG